MTGTPIRWSNPSTWPWMFYVWIGIVVAANAVGIWRWVKRWMAQGWPTAEGRIESTSIERRTGFLRGVNNRTPFTASLRYSYSLDGQNLSGVFTRRFGTEAEGKEFVRSLEASRVVVSYNPRRHSDSTLTSASLSTILGRRPPRPEGEFEVPVAGIPAWSKPLLWPLIGLSAVGLALSLWVHLGALGGYRVAPQYFFVMLHLGIFVVWLPTMLVAKKRIGNMQRRDFWKLVLRGSPNWMRYMVYGFGAYAVVNFLIFLTQAPSGGSGDPPAVVWRGFSGHWMAFYSAAMATLYAAVEAPVDSSAQK